MFKAYLKLAVRNLVKSKGYSFINVSGLATGMAAAMLIGLWVYDELTYDRNFSNHQRIARVMQNQVFDGQVQTWFSQAMQLGPELRTTYGNNFDHVVISTFPDRHSIAFDDKKVNSSGCFMEPGIADMLTLNMIQGNHSSLNEANAVMLSQSTAKSLFGGDDPLNKILKVDNQFDVKVSGVYEDLPDNSSFSNLKIILPWALISADLEKRTQWGNSWFQCFVQIEDNADMNTVSTNIRDAKMKNVMADENNAKFKPELFLHPMNRWHLYSDFKNGVSVGGNVQYVWMLSVIGSFILFLACINFMNLSTAQSEKKAKEVGIRKTVGSARIQLIMQFFTDSLFVTTVALAISLIALHLLLPWFNEISGKRIAIPLDNFGFWISCAGFSVFTGLIAGSYPALYLSSFQPVKVLKGPFRSGRFSALPRKTLVVVQFTVSVTLIIGTAVIFRQIRFAQDRPIGYTVNGMISVPIRTDEIMKHYDALRNDLFATAAVEEIAATESSITNMGTTNSGFIWNGKDPAMGDEFVTIGVTPEFGKTIGWQIKEGKDFTRDLASDSAGFIVNETAVRYMGLKDPVGEVIRWGKNGEWKIIGVAQDMITQSPYSAVNPMIFFLKSKRIPFIRYNLLNIKLRPSTSAAEALVTIENVFKKYDPDNAFEYAFADQEFGKKFSNEKRIAQLALTSTILAIFISCLGLLGLASFVTEQRTKEIGIRKVLGASIGNVWQLLSGDFVVLVIIASAIAVPVSAYFMGRWLQQYEYRSEMASWVFIASAAGALVVTMVTVSFHTLKASMANPVKSLRSE